LATVKLIDDKLLKTLPATFSTILNKLPDVLLLEQNRVESVQREPDIEDKLLVLVTVTVLFSTNPYWDGIVTTIISPAKNLFVVLIVSVNCCNWLS
jgi:hypothetical protein